MTYPDVPNLPGVPPLLRDPTGALGSFSAVLDTPSQDIGTQPTPAPVWGIFDDTGAEIISPDTFVGMQYSNSTRLSNYPLEQGAFESYNKVNNPYDVNVTMAVGGSEANRAAFLAIARDIANSMGLYTVVTPEEVFPSVNIERYDYSRTVHNGVGIVSVTFYLKQIRINATAEFTNQPDKVVTTDTAAGATTTTTADTAASATPLAATNVQNPASASAQNLGQVQARPATLAESAPASNALTTLPPGYTQDPATNVVSDAAGNVDPIMTIVQGTKYAGSTP